MHLLGSLYDHRGHLITDSKRAKLNRAWSAQPQVIALPRSRLTQRVAGRTFYAGHLLHVFGHLLLEMLPRFWPALDFGEFDQVLFRPARAGRNSGSPDFEPYERDTLIALGVDPEQVVLVGDRPLVVEDLTVSTPALVLKYGVDPAILVAFDRLRSAFAGTGGDTDRRVYLSRTRLTDGYRKATNEDAIETMFEGAGFEIVHPQELTLAEQVATVAAATAIAGCDGSALHLGAFARPGTVLLAIDSRVVVNQFMLDRVRGLDAVHVLAASTALDDRASTWTADLGAVRAGLAVAGLRD
jgi:capsular polysaccharide biosynthesis protein